MKIARTKMTKMVTSASSSLTNLYSFGQPSETDRQFLPGEICLGSVNLHRGEINSQKKNKKNRCFDAE